MKKYIILMYELWNSTLGIKTKHDKHLYTPVQKIYSQ